MKACPLCKSTYDDWIDFCFNDGMPLVAEAIVASSGVGALESVLDAPDIPFGLLDATDLPEPNAAMAPVAPPPRAPAPPINVGAAGFDPSPEAPPTPLRFGAGGFDATLSVPTPPIAPAPPPPVAPRVPGAVDASALEDIAAVLSGRPSSTPVPSPPAAVPIVMPAPTMPPPSALLAPPPDPSAVNAPTLIPVDASQPRPPAPIPPAPPVTPPVAPPSLAPEPSVLDDVAPPVRPAGVRRRGPPLVAVGGLIAAAIAVAGVIWLLVRPTAIPTPDAMDVDLSPPGQPVAETPAVPAPPPAELPPEPVAPPAIVPPVAVPGVAPVVIAAPFPGTAPVTPTPIVPPATVTAPVAPVTPVPTVAPTGDGVVEVAPWGGDQVAPASTATLTILVDPDGSSVFVDDVSRGTGTASVELPPGPHRVRVEHAGYKSEAREVDLRAGATTVPFNLKPDVVTGQVNVYGPMGFRVSVDGHDMGPMPVTVQVSEGVRQFKLSGESGEACTIPKEIAFRSPGRPETVTLQCP